MPYSGASYKEINDNIELALHHNKDVKLIIRCLDIGRFFDDKDTMRNELGTYPTYLYNSNPMDDMKYIFNRDVLINRCWKMYKAWREGAEGGITSFDDYARWMASCKFGADYVLQNQSEYQEPMEQYHLGENEKKVILENHLQKLNETLQQSCGRFLLRFFRFAQTGFRTWLKPPLTVMYIYDGMLTFPAGDILRIKKLMINIKK